MAQSTTILSGRPRVAASRSNDDLASMFLWQNPEPGLNDTYDEEEEDEDGLDEDEEEEDPVCKPLLLW